MYCPLMSYQREMYTEVTCTTTCMWYNHTEGECAILTIAKEITRIRKEK